MYRTVHLLMRSPFRHMQRRVDCSRRVECSRLSDVDIVLGYASDGFTWSGKDFKCMLRRFVWDPCNKLSGGDKGRR